MALWTVFTAEGCHECEKARGLMTQKGLQFNEISLTECPQWKPLLFLLSQGAMKLPMIFVRDTLIGELKDLQQHLEKGVETLTQGQPKPSGPSQLTLRKPSGLELAEMIPKEICDKWQGMLEAVNSQLGGTEERSIESLLITLKTPEDLVIVCTAGPSAKSFEKGSAVPLGAEEEQTKLFCQVAMDTRRTVFVDETTVIPGSEQNVVSKFGYSHYLGSPWFVGCLQGTVVALEKKEGILRSEHITVIEQLRDSIEKEMKSHA